MRHRGAGSAGLVARMTLDQKIGQMTQPERLHVTPEEAGAYHIGSVLSGRGFLSGAEPPRRLGAMNDAYWGGLDAGG